MSKTFTSKLLSQGSIEQEKLPTNAKNFCFGGGFNKNINFSTKFQCWIGWKTNNLKLLIPHCNIYSSLQYTAILFICNLSYKKSKSVKYRVIGSLVRRHQLVKDRDAQTCTPSIWIGLTELDNSYARVWCEFFLLWLL